MQDNLITCNLNVILLADPSRPRGYKTFIMLNSAEHEIINAHKYKSIKNVKMKTILGILTFMSKKIFMLS